MLSIFVISLTLTCCEPDGQGHDNTGQIDRDVPTGDYSPEPVDQDPEPDGTENKGRDHDEGTEGLDNGRE